METGPDLRPPLAVPQAVALLQARITSGGGLQLAQTSGPGAHLGPKPAGRAWEPGDCHKGH